MNETIKDIPLSDFLYFTLIKNVLTSDSNLALAVVAVAGGVGCCLAVGISQKLSRDRTFVNVIMSDDKAAEMQLEDDYGMIDGIVNNGAKQPEQNQPVKAADDRSERPSGLAKLRKLQAEDKQTAARHRSAERDEI